MLLGDAGLGTKVETRLCPQIGPGAVIYRDHFHFHKAAVAPASRWRLVGKLQLLLDLVEARLLAQGIEVLPEGERVAHVYQRVENDQAPCGQLAH